MKLIRFGDPGQETPGLILQDGTRIDASAAGSDYSEEFFANDGLKQLYSWLQKNSASAPRVSPSVRLGPPIRRPSKIVCIGLNYRDHAAETKAEPPKEPVLFFKATTSLVGPNDLGSRTGSNHRQTGAVRAEGKSARLRCWLRAAQRLFRAPLSTGTWRTMGEGQERGHICAARPVPGNV